MSEEQCGGTFVIFEVSLADGKTARHKFALQCARCRGIALSGYAAGDAHTTRAMYNGALTNVRMWT